MFTFEIFERGTKCHLRVWKIFIMSVAASIEELLKIHEPDHFDLYQGHSSNRYFQFKSMGFHLNGRIVLNSLHGPKRKVATNFKLPYFQCVIVVFINSFVHYSSRYIGLFIGKGDISVFMPPLTLQRSR